MEKSFYALSEALIHSLKNGEHLQVSIEGEFSQFIRFSQSKVRQSGLVDDTSLRIIFIKDQRSCSGSFTLCGSADKDEKSAMAELNRLRAEVSMLPKDPFIVMPKDTGSSREDHKGNLLSEENAVAALSPAMQDVDLAGIWASGSIFIGHANSAGQKHWFSTDTFSLDYSLISPDEKMVKATFAGSNWSQSEYDKYMADSILKLRMLEKKQKGIKPGSYRTYIAPAGVAEIIDMFSWGGISEAAIQQGDSSLIKLKTLEEKLSPCFSLTEDFSNGTVPRFNGTGEIAPEKLPLIIAGSLKNTLVCSRTEKEYKVQTNYATSDESLRSPVMSPGNLNEESILSNINEGVYLSNLHYLNWSDKIGGRVTGMTRYACFWVENGEIVAPIQNMRFDDSFYNFFGENLEAVSNKVEFNPEVGTYESRSLGGTHCPGVLLSSFSLTL